MDGLLVRYISSSDVGGGVDPGKAALTRCDPMLFPFVKQSIGLSTDWCCGVRAEYRSLPLVPWWYLVMRRGGWLSLESFSLRWSGLVLKVISVLTLSRSCWL